MGKKRDPQDRETFGDVLLARLYLGELSDTGKLSRDLQAAVDQRGAEHVKRVAQIIAKSDGARGYVERRAHEFAEQVVAILKAKRDAANAGQEGSVDSGQDPAVRNADGASHE